MQKSCLRGSIAVLLIQFFCLSGMVYAEETFDNREKAIEYVVFTRPLFDKITYETIPKKEDIITALSTFACPGEYEPVTFAVFTSKPLDKVKITVTDLKGEKGVIPGENIDIRIVKVWKGDKPELLLKDDSFLPQGMLPSIPVPDVIETDIPEFTSKQFWLTVKIPNEASPGVYTSTISVEPANSDTRRILLNVRVLSITLATPRQNYGIYFRCSLRPSARDAIDAELYEKYLKDIKEHGLNAVWICAEVVHDSDLIYLKQALDMRVKLGLTGLTTCTSNPQQVICF